MTQFIKVHSSEENEEFLINLADIVRVYRSGSGGCMLITVVPNTAPYFINESMEEIEEFLGIENKKFDYENPTCGNCGNQIFSETSNMITCVCCSWSMMKRNK